MKVVHRLCMSAGTEGANVIERDVDQVFTIVQSPRSLQQPDDFCVAENLARRVVTLQVSWQDSRGLPCRCKPGVLWRWRQRDLCRCGGLLRSVSLHH